MKKKIIILLGLFLSVLFSQTESIKVNPNGSFEIVDDSLLPENYFLSDTNNLKKLDLEVYNIIKPELDKMVSDYRNEINSNINSVKYTERVPAGVYYDESAYLTHLLSMNNPSQYEADYLKSMYTTVTYKTVGKEKNKTFEINRSLWSKSVEWSDIVKFFGGYSELRKKEFTKDKVHLFDVEGKLVSVELTGKNTCISNVEIIGNKEFGLKYHLIPKSKYIYEGTYSMDELNDYSDIYNGFNPNIHFSFEKKKYMPEMKFTRKLNDERYSPSVESYQDLMKQMISDLIPYDKYLKMEHILVEIEYNRKRKLQEKEQKNKECDELFHSFQEYCIDIIEKHISYSISINTNKKKLKKLIKNYKKNNSNPIIGTFNKIDDGNVNSISLYSREFLEYYSDKYKSNKHFVRSYLQIVDNINKSPNIIFLLFVLCNKNPKDETGEEMSIGFRHVPGKYEHMSKSENQRRVEYLINNLRLDDDPFDLTTWFFGKYNYLNQFPDVVS